ncbi:methylated-DNA--[protein]-cysteine S-methyltransferase [Tenacibaculum skagerrakense]|uniref:methylated-DNA--[protein]-cysteine S-methyltransferase n=1 Tax=Tenacibaculum skagerrakense TaxID=186571 RepID=UPI00104F728D|nr:methylated-DNA--[protein]-cysteine S-methyltransferase [Tenacibaculum skagerrakense]
MHTAYYKSPIGTIEVKGNSKEIHSIYFIEEDISTTLEVTSGEIKKCIQQLDEYFLGNRKEFELNLSPNGTEFQGKVWTELLKVPFGKTRSYLEQSKKLGDVKAIRAVASANGKNPISIIIPCHRIVGSDGSLTGYAGGVWRKKWLLEHENGNKQQSLF